MSRSDFEILDEYLKKDVYYNKLSESDKMLCRLDTRDSLEFQRYLLSVRIREFINSMIDSFKK